ncbi:MFS transporter [Streptomyces sp. L7]
MAVIPLGISIMRDELPPERLGSATALMSASLGVGGALGLPTAAFIAEKADWHVLFWTAAVLGAVVTALVVALVPESARCAAAAGSTSSAASGCRPVWCVCCSPSPRGADWGWGSGTTTGLFVVAVAVLLVWGWWELRTDRPLVDLRTSSRRQVLLTNLASVVFGFAMFAMSLAVPQLLQLPTLTGYGLGQTVLAAGLTLGPSGLVMMATAPLSARISAAAGPRGHPHAGRADRGRGLRPRRRHAGRGLAGRRGVLCDLRRDRFRSTVRCPRYIMAAVPLSETAAANSLNSLMRSIGTSASSAVAGVVLAHMTTTFGSLTVPLPQPVSA